MQSGYGEIQQFMVDGSLFSPPPPTNPNAASADMQHKLYHHLVQPQQQQQHHHHQQQIHQPQPQHHHHHHHHHQTAQAPTMAPQFSHLIHPIPITQQLFHHPHHQFQLFHPPPHHQHQHQHHPHHHQPQHGLVLDQDSAPQENDPNSPAGNSAVPGPSFLASAMSFKLGVNESSGGGSRDGLNEDDGMLHGDDGSESRLHSWHRDEDSAAAANIKEPFWRRPFDIDYINRNNKRPLKDKSPDDNNNNNSTANYSKKSKEDGLIAEHNSTQVNQGNPAAATADSNYKQLFSELEAIYKPGSGGGGNTPNNNQTGSGSALTGDDNPLLPDTTPCPAAMDNEHGSDTSDGGDAPPPPPLLLSPVLIKKSSHKGGSSSSSGSRRKQRARRRQQEQLRSIAAFIESLVKQVMSHQESLHQKFLDVMERRDKERTSRDEAWRKQEAARSISEATARAQDRALAANREAAIVAFLEKITGERIELPSPLRFLEDQSHKDQDCNTLELYNADICNNAVATNVQLNTSRWPKAEVQALIRVRSGFESRFQEPGLKGPLWEEVSTMMATMGYCRNAKRCKEKWENINKYFRKTKDSGKKRPEHSKTCPYFQQLDQLYSKSGTPPLSSNADGKERKDNNSELLDAIVVSNDHQSFQLGSARTEMNGNEDQGNNEAGSSAMAGNDHDNEEERDGEEEGEGDSQDQHEQERMERDHQHEEDPQHDTTFFFQRLRS